MNGNAENQNVETRCVDNKDLYKHQATIVRFSVTTFCSSYIRSLGYMHDI